MASRAWRHLALLACALSLTAVAPAAASGPAVNREVLRVAGADTTLTRTGLYRVRPEVGPELLTHGPDGAAPLDAMPSARRAAASGFEAGSAERAPVCANSDAQRVLYAHPAGTPDRLAAVKPQIQATMRRLNAVLNDESIASGGPTADYRVRCDAGGEISVDSFTSASASFADIVSAARTEGYSSNAFDYIVFFHGAAGRSCGIASYNDDERPGAENVNNLGGGYAIAYAGCWANETPMHEIGHTMGGVQYGAPHSTGTGGHCWDEADVLCYSPDGGDLHQEGPVYACDTIRFDCGFDDYFDSAPEPGEYLETHWNLGSPANAFISFAGALPPPRSQPRERWRMRPIRVRRHTRRLEVSIRAAGDAILFLSRGHKPTERRFACRARGRHDGRPTCRVRRPQRGRWVIGILRPAGERDSNLRVHKQLEKRRQAR
jgi:hypothetical protein